MNLASMTIDNKQLNCNAIHRTAGLILFASFFGTVSVQAENQLSEGDLQLVYKQLFGNNKQVAKIKNKKKSQSISKPFVSNLVKKALFTKNPVSIETIALNEITNEYNQALKVASKIPAKQFNIDKPTTIKDFASTIPTTIDEKAQVAVTRLKGKDPELVAFYEQVFGGTKDRLSEQGSASVTKEAELQNIINELNQQIASYDKGQKTQTGSHRKDPELVAFYEQVFGENRHITFNDSSKTHKVYDVKSKDRKMVNKKAKKVTTMKNNGSAAAVELQKLIDELRFSEANIIK